MAWQKHIIQRQVIELQLQSGLDSRDVQSRVSKLFIDHLLPLIDQALTRSSPSATVDKIDRLELDLGRIQLGDLENLLVTNTAAALETRLPLFMNKATPVQPNHKSSTVKAGGSGMDLIAYFLQTGLLPWWAKENSHRAFEQALDAALRQEPQQLLQLLRALCKDSAALKRLIYSSSDAMRYRIIQRFIPGITTGIIKPDAYFPAMPEAMVHDAATRQVYWQSVFTAALQESVVTAKEFMEKVNTLFAGRAEIRTTLPANKREQEAYRISDLVKSFSRQNEKTVEEHKSLLNSMPENEKSDMLHLFSVLDKKIIEELKALGATSTSASPPEFNEQSSKTLPEHLGLLQHIITAIDMAEAVPFEQKLQTHHRFESLVHGIKTLFADPAKQNALSSSSDVENRMQQVVAVTEQLIKRIQLPFKESSNVKNALEDVDAAIDKATALVKTALAPVPQHDNASNTPPSAASRPALAAEKGMVQPQKFYDPFSETEKIYIRNAGLVLLWPFLNRFFQNVGLVNDKAFVDESKAVKACLMLQYITGTAPEAIFEAQLPLNKVLCGIDLDQPVDTQWAIAPDEAEAVDNFCNAVIQNGPLWKSLSVNGFRQAYLNREGALSTRDGNWLLQVKRETYDIIIDRLPWTIQAVKLPWMKHLVFVEW